MFGSGAPQATVVVRDPARLAGAAARRHAGWRRPTSTGCGTRRTLTAVIEVAARNVAGIDALRRAPHAACASRASAAARAGRATRRAAPREDIAAHYDLGNDLFGLMLDETMMYSGAIFERRDMTLEDASRRQARPRSATSSTCGRRDHVLEIGTGWGGFARARRVAHAAAA